MSTQTDIPPVQAFDARAALERRQQSTRELTYRCLDVKVTTTHGLLDG
jgi:hypothetical protein